MAIVMVRRAVTPVGRSRPGAARPSHLPLTLADLITAIQDVVGPEDDGLVAATVRHLLRSGRLTCVGRRSRTAGRWYAGGSAANVQVEQESGESSGSPPIGYWKEGEVAWTGSCWALALSCCSSDSGGGGSRQAPAKSDRTAATACIKERHMSRTFPYGVMEAPAMDFCSKEESR